MSLAKKLIRWSFQRLPARLTSPLPLRWKARLGIPLDRWENQKLFWRNWFRREGGHYHTRYFSKTDDRLRREMFPDYLENYIAELQDEFPGEPIAGLDVGSGPISHLTWAHEKGLLRVTCLDALGAEYQRLYERYDVAPGTKIVTAYAEQMDYCEEFHIAYARNALDHCVSPTRTFENMVRAVKPGGYVVIGTRVDEGTAMNWSGGHQHNLDLEGEDLVLTSRQGESVVLTNAVDLTYVWSQRVATPAPHKGWLDVVYQRSPEKAADRGGQQL